MANIKKLNGYDIIDSTPYSTTEIKTGRTWIDGKPIYRKVVNTGDLTDMTRYTGDNGFNVQSSISQIDQITNIKWIGGSRTETAKPFMDILSYKWISDEPTQEIIRSLCWYSLSIYYDPFLNDTVLHIESHGIERTNWINSSYAIVEYTKAD